MVNMLVARVVSRARKADTLIVARINVPTASLANTRTSLLVRGATTATVTCILAPMRRLAAQLVRV